MTPPYIAQKCLSFVAGDTEREDRLGDLEEVYRATIRGSGLPVARRQYIRSAILCIFSIMRRRVTRAVLFGGQDMVRIFLWAAVSSFFIFLFYVFAGGSPWVHIQPFEWMIILSAICGFALAGGRAETWRLILRDLRRYDRLNRPERVAARSSIIAKLTSGVGLGDPDLAHLENIVSLMARCPGPDLDRLISGNISLFHDRCRRRIRIIDATVTDTYVGSAIALLLGLSYTIVNIADESLAVVGGLLGGALSGLVFGLLVARAVLAPIASRLTDLYSTEYREMEALRLSICKTVGEAEDDGDSAPFSQNAFETLLSGKFV